MVNLKCILLLEYVYYFCRVYSMTFCPIGLRRNVKSVVLVGVDPNFTDVTFTFGYPITLLI